MMKLAYAACLALGLTVGVTHAAGTDCQATSTRLLDHLDKGDYAGAAADFDDTMKADLGADRLARIWPALSQQFGARGAREQPQLSQRDGRTLVITPLHYGQRLINARVSCDSDGRIGGFYIKPQQSATP
ncbi:DUF3887 domain-containing protein [Rhodanobacter sp. C03]|uniref:DUF3887 domain-containing protein n=1 Tax=Rhodanobacter sp. C03 TaxID=1945858 RepID=UPI0009CC4E16|nr:DUF3887 domain-containing protein [Rhodanobacter sp. C03]OOG54488.1 hypothetical protein B0E48_14460 [Rhodanobacter sp. C03]